MCAFDWTKICVVQDESSILVCNIFSSAFMSLFFSSHEVFHKEK